MFRIQRFGWFCGIVRSNWLKNFVLLGAWLTAILLGMSGMLAHRYASGAIAINSAWPLQSKLSLHPSERTLLVFLHPQCPCAAATVEEISRMLAKAGQQADLQLVVFRPENQSQEWSETPTIQRAQLLGASRCWDDVNGRIASQFHVSTSGQVLLFETDGRLLFNGGVTDSRGHQGDNPNADALIQLLMQSSQNMQQTVVRDVFGCEITPAIAPAGEPL